MATSSPQLSADRFQQRSGTSKSQPSDSEFWSGTGSSYNCLTRPRVILWPDRPARVSASKRVVHLGHLPRDVTNAKGFFAFVFLHPAKADLAAEYGFRLEIPHPATSRIQSRLRCRCPWTSVKSSSCESPASETPEPPSPRIDQLAASVHLELPKDLLQFLEARSPAIRSLADIRRESGIRHLMGLPEAGRPAAENPRSPRQPGTLSSNVELNADSIGKGFTSVRAIAKATRADFVAVTQERIGYFRGGEMHVAAGAQAAYADKPCIDRHCGRSGQRFSTQDPCRSKESRPCFPTAARAKSARPRASPLAYLADLLNYALAHLKNGEAAISL